MESDALTPFYVVPVGGAYDLMDAAGNRVAVFFHVDMAQAVADVFNDGDNGDIGGFGNYCAACGRGSLI